jgi:hypothetical protein
MINYFILITITISAYFRHIFDYFSLSLFSFIIFIDTLSRLPLRHSRHAFFHYAAAIFFRRLLIFSYYADILRFFGGATLRRQLSAMPADGH